ncbi:MAG: GNAT family N-acetyltransferase [Burkholderiaceae bacterium]
MLDLASIPAGLREVRDPLMARIEDAALTASQPREQAFYDGWVLRYANGKAKRARSVNLIGAGERPLDDKLAYCRAFYAGHGVPLILRMTPFSRPHNVDRALNERGYAAWEDTRVMVASLADFAANGPDVPMTMLDRAAFGSAMAALHRLDPARAAVERDRFAYSVADGIYLGVVEHERVVACGSAVVDGDLVGIFGMVTMRERRDGGIGTALVHALLRQARTRNCTTAYLQVEAGNAAARRVYSKFGFRDGYAYWYRRPADGET